LSRLGATLVLALIAGASAAGAAPPDTPLPGSGVIDLAIPGGQVQRVLYRAPERPVAALVLLTGGDGVLGIDGAGRIKRDGNFLIRTREQWLARGFAVAIPDVPGDRTNLLGSRLSRSYGEILRRVVEHVRSRTNAPIWLVGTSAGSPAAAVGAARLPQGEVAGLVLTSSVSRPGRIVTETVFGAELERVTVPTLVVSHQSDRCQFTPPSDAEAIRRALTKASKVEVMLFEGGSTPRSDACEAFSEHGYLGIETRVVDRIAGWIKAQAAP
jgi:hypothetical protein